MVSTAAFHARVRGSVPGLGGFKETKNVLGSLRDREVACSASDRQGSNFESCVWRTVSSQSSHHPQEVLLARFRSLRRSLRIYYKCTASACKRLPMPYELLTTVANGANGLKNKLCDCLANVMNACECLQMGL